MTSIELNNPSAFHALRVFTQARASNVVTPAAKPQTREELARRGAELLTKTYLVPAANPSGTYMTAAAEYVATGSAATGKPDTHDVEQPRWRLEGAESLEQWIDRFSPQTPSAKAQTAKRETRAELEVRGAEVTMKPTRGMARVDGAMRSVTREFAVPLWQAEGAESLNEWCTGILEKIADDARKGPPVISHPVQRVVDSWLARVPFGSVQPGGKATLTLSEEKRYVVECDEEVGLAIANTSSNRTLRLRNVETNTGETTNTKHIAPARDYAQCAVVIANGKTAAVIELQPT